MASLVPSYEYDIFISYRHKDNKYDGWVTEFVANLKKEIEATFKEDISIYFDVNPHDGLLETHDVDDSLKDKLKCLIFIPIISRTYCDAKSFAWTHEFLAFLKTAAIDSIGLKVKLPNGNTASRVLPIRIHELDPHDKKTIEAELQGVLRAIDFTYIAAGVNRPLVPKDDEIIKGSGQSTYRDQVNKTANAISDLIAGMQGKEISNLEVTWSNDQPSVPQTRLKKKRSFKIPTLSKHQVLVATLIISLLLLTTISVIHFSESNVKPTYKASILPPENTTFNETLNSFALSPDGTMLAFVAFDSLGAPLLYVRSLNATDARALKGTEGSIYPFWSPDSRFIGFLTNGRKLKKIDIGSGTVTTVSNSSYFRGASWNEEDVIIFSTSQMGSISRVSANGGNSMRVTQLDTARHESNHRWPVFLPDGKHFFFSSRINRTGIHPDDAIFLASLDSTVSPKMITKASSSPAFANGYLIYYQGESLVAHRFDSDKLQLTGDAISITDQIHFDALTANAPFSVSQNGLLAYQRGLKKDGRMDFIWHNRNGNRLGSFSKASTYNSIQISPDGNKIAFKELNLKKGKEDLWLYEINRDVWTRFTMNGRNLGPVWSPDGKMIAYGSSIRNPSGNYSIYIRATSGAGNEESILETKEIKTLSDWSRDGKFIAYQEGRDVWILPMSPSGDKAAGKPFLFLQTEWNESSVTFSPDGRWMAYESNESGSHEVYIRPFPGPGGKWQVSTKNGHYPKWRGDGKELFFLSSDFTGIMSAEIKTTDTNVDMSSERLLFKSGIEIYSMYDVTSDGQRFLIAMEQKDDTSMPITLVVNWLEELKKNK